jgi:hypothetical protein
VAWLAHPTLFCRRFGACAGLMLMLARLTLTLRHIHPPLLRRIPWLT